LTVTITKGRRRTGRQTSGESLRAADQKGQHVTVQEGHDARHADEFLRTAYPDEHERAFAIRRLGWIAGQLEADELLTWWTIPAWVRPKQILIARRFVACAILGIAVGVAMAVTSRVWVVVFLGILGFAAVINMRRSGQQRRSAAPRRAQPGATVVCWPRRRQLGGLLTYTVVTLGLGLLPGLVSLWVVPADQRPGATAGSTYRADRLTTVIYGLACSPLGALLGILVLSPAYGSAGWLVGTVVIALGTGAWGGLVRGSSYSRLKLTELVLAARWHERAGLLRLLADAESRGVVHRAGVGYEFRDDALRVCLADLGRAALTGHQQAETSWSARTWTRLRAAGAARLVRFMKRRTPGEVPRHPLLSAVSGGLTRPRIDRIAFDLAVGAAIAVLAGYLLFALPRGTRLAGEILDAVLLSLIGLVVATMAGKGLLSWAAAGARWAATRLPELSRRARIGAVAGLVVIAAVLVAEAGTFLAGTLAFGVPAVFVTACGLWVCRLAFRRWRASPRSWLRKVPDQVAVATSAAALLVGVDRGLLTAQWATVLLFPVAVAGSVRLWTVMRDAGRLAIRAAADIALSLLLGGELVLFLVWLGNVLGMPRSEVDLIRTRLGAAGSYASIYDGGLLWAGIYATLAVASVAFALHPGRLRSVIEWFQRLSLPQVFAVVQRVATGVYVSLLTIVFVGAAAPAALTPALQHQLRTAYVVALQRKLRMEAETSACDEIRSELSALTSPSAVTVLGDLVQAIRHDARQQADSRSDAETENALAFRVGEEQAAALSLPGRPAPAPSGAASTESADPGGPAEEARALSRQATETAAEENADDQARDHLKAAFELAVTAVVNAVPVPDISKNEVAQIFTQYLSALVDDSKVIEVFEARLEHILHRHEPPGGEALIVPDPAKLDNAAQYDLDHETAVQGVTVLPPDASSVLLNPSASVAEISREEIKEAVSAASQSQQIQETGTCPECSDSGNGDDGSRGSHEDDPAPDTHAGDY
jgi:hypothetical protein